MAMNSMKGRDLNIHGELMKIKVFGIMSLIVISGSICGCFSDDSSSGNEPMFEIKNDSESFQDVFDFPATQSEEEIVASIRIITSHSNLTSISFSISLEDNDPNTNEDYVSTIEISDMRADGDNNVYSETEIGGEMPINLQVDINETEIPDNPYSNVWNIFIHVTLKPSEDQWPGPLIWRGFTDSGFSYDIGVSYEYIYSG